MKNKQLNRHSLFACLGVLVASVYPLYMGVKVLADMLINGAVMKENYPKYIIPYTPICIALLVGVLLMPVWIKRVRRFALFAGSAVSTAVFFVVEILFEKKVVVSAAHTSAVLEDWQMYMCYAVRDGLGGTVTSYKTQTPVEILMGDYNPAFKLHFYLISVLLILSVLSCLYGFARMIWVGDRSRFKPLVIQSIACLAFLGLCILACFTAFWRDGNLEVSAVSAVLMTAFFVLFGLVGGLYTGSFLLGKSKIISIVVPAIVSSVFTALMYVGEMILLHGHLYVLGEGFLFASLPGIVLAPFDILVILAGGVITGFLFNWFNKPGKTERLERADG